jgi:alkylation response protein AidB-like acyl-CoA dehydrogenase
MAGTSVEDQEVADDLIEALRTWVAREVVPTASAFEHADEYPEPLVEQMKAFGIFGTTIPEDYGGLGLGSVTYARVIEELSYGWMSLAGILNTHSIVSNLLKRSGTEEQRQRWLPSMVNGEPRAAFSLSEPDAGSDTKALRCKAIRDGDEYVITGTKMWVTNGERAGLVALAARTDEGITCFIVEKDPGPSYGGISVSKRIEKLGYKGLETVEMTYDGHRVPADCVLGGEAGLGRGLSQVLSSLELGRVNVAARAVGVARAAYDAAMRYSLERETFGKPIFEHQAISFKIAEMGTKLHAARLMTLDAAARFDRGERCDVEAGMAKLFASETALELSVEAMRIHGGYGFTTEFPVERYYRDAPLMIIGEGTNEIQRMVIARGLLARWSQGGGGAASAGG